MKTLLSLLLLFIIIINVVSSEVNRCTPEKTRRCCMLDCVSPYCDSETGSCDCGDIQLSEDQCTMTEDKCTADQVDHCCLMKCQNPYCDPGSGRCGCGDSTLFGIQCYPKE